MNREEFKPTTEVDRPGVRTTDVDSPTNPSGGLPFCARLKNFRSADRSIRTPSAASSSAIAGQLFRLSLNFRIKSR
jgi:hypothetical protein